MKRLAFTVTNDLTYDQRMIRICSSLANGGYAVTLIGIKTKKSLPFHPRPFTQKRIPCFFLKGKLFYAEYNIRLFFYLLFRKADLICAIDLDSILPCLLYSKIRGVKRVYDAHELFCEMKEIATRPRIYAVWKRIEKITVPRFSYGYTVNQQIADEFRAMYDRRYEVIRNIPPLRTLPAATEKTEKYIYYQGAVNEGRSFETLIPAMKLVNARLLIAGDGNFMGQARQLVQQHQLEEKVIFLGKIEPEKLAAYSTNAWAGVTLFDKQGLSNYYSLANRFFDYLHAGIPQLCVDYPAYQEINKSHPIAVLISDLSSENIAAYLNMLLTDDVLYKKLRENCLLQREKLNWQEEEKKLLSFYQAIF